MNAWLFKSEPDDYSLDDLRAAGLVRWDSIRNYGARNHLRACRPGDLVLFYHSGRKPGIVGTARIASLPYPDPTQFDESSDYHDPGSNPDEPRWVAVDIEYAATLDEPIPLATLKRDLPEMAVVKRQRLSVSPVTLTELQALFPSGEF